MTKHLQFNKRLLPLIIALLVGFVGTTNLHAQSIYPCGVLPKAFSVSNSTTVFFSRGNLQYIGSANTPYWKFADHQWVYLGDNGQGSDSPNVDRDLFGWGTSGYNHGANCYQPWSIIRNDSYYYAYGNSSYNLFDQTGQADWGYNAILNGGNQENSGWRTLTHEEWAYLFDTRNTLTGIRYAKAKVNNVKGVILLPDDWSEDYYALSNTNTSEASFSSNVITAVQWVTLEQHGAVFLPAAGFRLGASVYNDPSSGNYWSASYYSYSSSEARRVFFDDLCLNGSGDSYRNYGYSVRLVRSSQSYSIVNATANPTEGGAVSGGGLYIKGARCWLTATASAGYHFVNWTENGVEVSTDATYSFTVTGHRELMANFALQSSIPTGALNGWFSIEPNSYIFFSQGNLQYIGNAATPYWKFAEHQWDCLGNHDQGSNSPNVDRDLFGWGTSGYNHGANCYQPWSISETNSNYYAYGNSNYNLFDQTGQADWGYNAILNGGNTQNTGWRTLTSKEWEYLFYNRNTFTGIRYAKAKVNYVNGVILLPDDWRVDYYALSNTNTFGASFSSNVITADQWVTLEQHGAVFLPIAGYRYLNVVENVYSDGYYWSASCIYYLHFNDSYLSIEGGALYYGRSVRLVRSSQGYSFVKANANPAEGGAESGAGLYEEGAECTLTASASAGYTFVNWTEDGEVVSVNTAYTFTVTGNRNLVANFRSADADISDGVLNGWFSLGPNSYISFSQGNLQYIGNAATPYWKFAEHQWDYLGSYCQGYSQYSLSFSDKANRDLFGWGTSGYNHGSKNYQPWSIEASLGGYCAYGNSSYNLFDQTGQADWGYNAILNGGNQENSGWRTLAHEEWDYLFNTRNTLTGIRYAKAKVNNVNGVILLPDDWSVDYYALNNTNTDGASYSSNVITADQWVTLEQHGAVFLPAAGSRVWYDVDHVGSGGWYWSASYYSSSNAWAVFFGDSYLNTDGNNNRFGGGSVRLVRSPQGYSFVNVTANPAEGGAVSGGGLYEDGAECTLTATALAGYAFVNWTENGEVVSTDHTYSFIATEDRDRHLIANFVQLSNHWTVVTGMSGNMTMLAILKIDGVEPYAEYYELGAFSGEECRGTALPQFIQGYCIYSLTIVGENNGDPISFRIYDHYLNQDLDLYCTNELVFEEGSYYGFEAFYEINFFSRAQITAVADPEIGGTVSGEGGYFPGFPCTLTANANTGYTFINWTLDGSPTSSDSIYTFTVTDSENYVAHFDLNSYNVTVTAEPAEGGIVSGAGIYNHFDTCTLIAVANTGYTFAYWTLNGDLLSANANETMTIEESVNVVAHFTLNSYEITTSVMPVDAGVVEGFGVYDHFSQCTLTAIAATGYTFQSWTLDNIEVSTNPEISFEVCGPATYEAHFTLNSYEITADVTPAEGGTVSGMDTYYHFDNCTLTATADTGYTFEYWTLNGEVVSTDTSYTFEVIGPATYVAHFGLNSYEIVAVASPADGGSIEGAGCYNHFQTCTLTATANEGFVFNCWIVDGETVSTDTSYTFEVCGPVTVTALFYLIQTVQMNKGWTWWGTSVEQAGMDGLSLLENDLTPNGRVIKTIDEFVQYNAVLGWTGSLTSLTNEKGYRVQTTVACEASLTGPVANPEDHPIVIVPNWTWIGYPVEHQQTVGAALSGFEPLANDLIKGQRNSARYIPNVGWIPAGFTLKPGESYMYFSRATDNKTLVFTDVENIVGTKENDRYWRNDIHAYGDNLCLLAVVSIDGEEHRSEDLELGAFVNGECRGSAKLIYVEYFDRFFAMMNIMGEAGDEIEFAMMDRQGEVVTSSTYLTFVIDAIVGDFEEPFVVCFGDMSSLEEHQMTLDLYPNPVNRNESFNLLVPEDETITEWMVINVQGLAVRHEKGMRNNTVVDGLPISGVYLVRVACQSGNVYQSKLVIK